MSQYQACESHYPSSTVVNYFSALDKNFRSYAVRENYTVGPGTLAMRAIVIKQLSSSSQLTTSTGLSNNTQLNFGVQSPMITTFAMYSGKGISNEALIGVVAATIIGTLASLALGWILLRRRAASSTNDSNRPAESWGAIGIVPSIPSAVAVILGVASCLLAARRDWQEEIIRRWSSPNTILRVVQVLSFFLRLCSSVLAWCCVADVGWLLMVKGMGSLQMMVVLDMAYQGGTYAYVGRFCVDESRFIVYRCYFESRIVISSTMMNADVKRGCSGLSITMSSSAIENTRLLSSNLGHTISLYFILLHSA